MSLPLHKRGRYTSYALAAELPHPKLPPEVFIVIHRVLVRAFAILREEQQPLATMLEPPITKHLARVIENRLRQSGEVLGFGPPGFERVTREHEGDSFDGSLEAERMDLFFGIRPDDSFRSRIQSDQWGVFVECKPVDRKHKPEAKKMYCDEGIHRFVRGDYAWAMQDAMMVSYARDGYTITSHLSPAMEADSRLETEEALEVVDDDSCAATAGSEALHYSVHRRPFDWTEGRGRACSITIYHSWHDCTHPGELSQGNN